MSGFVWPSVSDHFHSSIFGLLVKQIKHYGDNTSVLLIYLKNVDLAKQKEKTRRETENYFCFSQNARNPLVY